LNETINQLDLRNARAFTDEDALRSDLEQHLAISGDVGKVRLTYHSTDKSHVHHVPQALGRAFLGYRLAVDRSENRPDSVRIASPVHVNPQPVRDDRLKLSAMTFAGLTGFAVILALAL